MHGAHIVLIGAGQRLEVRIGALEPLAVRQRAGAKNDGVGRVVVYVFGRHLGAQIDLDL